MSVNYKTLSDFEVATAEEAQSYFMDQAIIKVDTESDLTSLPNEVKAAYSLNTGLFWVRDNTNTWKRGGGAAEVSETAPSNPAVGQMWVKPSEVLPAPVRVPLGVSSVAVNATTTGTTYGPTAAITLPKAAMCNVALTAWVQVTGAPFFGRLKWTGAAASDSYVQNGGYGGNIYQALTGYQSHSLPFTVVLPAGTTTFQVEAWKGSASTSPTFSYGAICVTPVQWADMYTAGTF